jgi:NTP pyrophosphatase (non-canonical NTP hydrolase)
VVIETRTNHQGIARRLVAEIRKVFPDQPDWRFVTGVAEETGEFVGAFNKFSGTSRQVSSHRKMAAELADVVIAAYMAAEVLGIDLNSEVTCKAEIMSARGWGR